jgi:hypothetical protein
MGKNVFKAFVLNVSNMLKSRGSIITFIDALFTMLTPLRFF